MKTCIAFVSFVLLGASGVLLAGYLLGYYDLAQHEIVLTILLFVASFILSKIND